MGLRVSGVIWNWFVSMLLYKLSSWQDTWRWQYPYLKYDRTITGVGYKQRFTQIRCSFSIVESGLSCEVGCCEIILGHHLLQLWTFHQWWDNAFLPGTYAVAYGVDALLPGPCFHPWWVNTSHKKQVYVGMKPSKTNQTRWEWHHNTFTPSLHFVKFCCHLHKYALCLWAVYIGGLWKAVGWVVLGV